jgi:flagellar biosynthesis anti-sigma factor FlgM
MKVDNSRVDSGAPVTGVQADPPSRTGQPKPLVESDVVSLSSDLQLVDKATKAASVIDVIRPDLVAKARALLERGQLGGDLEKLADRMIDSLTESHDDRV